MTWKAERMIAAVFLVWSNYEYDDSFFKPTVEALLRKGRDWAGRASETALGFIFTWNSKPFSY